MKTKLILILTGLAIFLCSWKADTHSDLNVNSWNISVGNKELLASWERNKMGDTAVFDQTKYLLTDTLFAERYLCGQLGKPAVTTLTIKNQKNEIIKEVVNSNYKWGFNAYIKLSDFVALNDFKSGEVIGIFLTIDMKNDDRLDETVLLGRLKIK
ncbi:MAG: hypothetical protein ACTHJT_14265 [Cytophaga sp.]|uniref:hypothetical protein n=1 Tax=Cytophaga sp. TaxID=29535 RepID=UPI003F7D6300